MQHPERGKHFVRNIGKSRGDNRQIFCAGRSHERPALAMRSDSMMTGVPDPVIAFQHVFQARSRVVILRRLLMSPATFAELVDDLELSVGALRDGLNPLESVGYVDDDSPKSATRKTSRTLFRAVRETVMIRSLRDDSLPHDLSQIPNPVPMSLSLRPEGRLLMRRPAHLWTRNLVMNQLLAPLTCKSYET
jgi:DNA-binding HxlR family transcriptional regulator